jgi:hypothetical protein
MTSLSNISAEQTYPDHFVPDRFAHPGIVLKMLRQPEVLEIGEEVDSLKIVELLNEQERLLTGNCVEPLALTHANGSGRSIFAVYKDWTKAISYDQD